MSETSWEKKEKLGANQLLEQINALTKDMIERELKDISSKIEILHEMGLLKDTEEMQKMREQLKELKIISAEEK